MKLKRFRLSQFIIVSLAALMLVLNCFPTAVVEADSYVGALNGTRYSDFEDMMDDLEDDYEGKNVSIEMFMDWDASKDSQFDERMYIPEDCNATLNMHGHMFNRDNVKDDDYSDSGEMIYVDTGAKLRINGASLDSDKEISHTVRVFTNTKQKNADMYITVYGAVLAGGNSDAGPGCIYIDSGKEVVLNDVTIAGCKASYYWNPFVSFTGYGGGILITEAGTTLTMNNSTITGCLSQEDGGGIYAKNNDNISINLDNSHIDANFADSDGGGINLDGASVAISGKNGSTINGNKTVGLGGGVYFYRSDTTLSADAKGGLTINGNSAKQGGGVFLKEKNNELNNLIIANNKSSDLGGGVYVSTDYTTISSCEITGNNKYGVYMVEGCDEEMNIFGSTVIKDNTDGNLTLSTTVNKLVFNQDDGMEVHIGYEYIGSFSYYNLTTEPVPDYSNQLFADDENYIIAYSYHDHDNFSQGSNRSLLYMTKKYYDDNLPDYAVRTNPETVVIKTQEAHAYSDDSNRVYAGAYNSKDGVNEGTQYELRTLFPRHPSNADRNYKMYYSDGLFFEDPIIYNDHLASASYGMALAGAYLGDPDYEYKHAGARQFMADIGCPDQMIYVNDSNTTKPGTDSIGVTIASKTLQEFDGDVLKNTDYTLIAIVTRGANYEKEWTSNVTLDVGDKRDGEARGFSEAADQLMSDLDYYIDRYGLRDKVDQGKVKFWIAGFSRGGATANLSAKRILEQYCYKTEDSNQAATGNELFAYPLEAPQGGTDKAEKLTDKTKYFCIHNLINAGDIVPLVGPRQMGFKRYGVDHYLPGIHLGRKTREDYLACIKTTSTVPVGASAESGITSVTTYNDNVPLDSKRDKHSVVTETYKEYNARRDSLIKHLATINHTKLFFDYFTPYATMVNPGSSLLKKLGHYDGAKLEDFLPNFLAFLQQEGLEDNLNKTYEHEYRKKYAEMLQPYARAFFAEDSDEGAKRKLDAIKTAVKKIIESGIVDWSLLFNVIGDYYNIDDEGKRYVINFLWDTAEAYGAFNDLTSSEYDIVKSNWADIADIAFNFTDGDFQLGNNGQGVPLFPTGTSWVNADIDTSDWLSNKLIYTLTLYKNADMIINNNHDQEIGMAWTRTYDNYYSKYTDGDEAGEIYDNLYLTYKVNWIEGDNNPDNYSIDIPRAYVKDGSQESGYKELKEASEHPQDFYNIVEPNQKILLEVGEIHEGVSPANQDQGNGNENGDVFGEAIYYEIYDVSDEDNPSLIENKRLYRGGLFLPSSDQDKAYMVKTYAISLGKQSETATYYFTTRKGHEVAINDGSSDIPTINRYHNGENVTISANPRDLHYFERWVVELLTEGNVVVEDDIASAILNGKQNESTVIFTMPEDGSEYAEGKQYPDNYKLYIQAVCKDAIKHAETAFGVPTPAIGDDPQTDLVKTADVEFTNREAVVKYPVVWTYVYEGVTYPATDTVYSGVDYIATIVMPKDQANDIVFAPTDDLSADFNGDRNRVKENGISISRNDSDGSAVLVIQFKTTEDGGPPPPAAEITLTVRTYDLNLKDHLSETATYKVLQNQEILLTAPAVNDEVFFMWDFGSTGIRLAEGYKLTDKTVKLIIPSELSTTDLSIDAQYIPVLNNIIASIKVPEGGEQMQTAADRDTLKVTITNEYQIHPDYVSITWTPQPLDGDIADYLKNYTVSITLAPETDEQGNKYIYAKTAEDTEYRKTAAIFNYSENTSAKINDYDALLDKKNNSISYTFPITTYTLEEIYEPADVKGIPYGSSEEQIRTYLPASVDILLNDSIRTKAEVNWTDLHRIEPYGDIYDKQEWQASGTVVLPYGVVNKKEISLDVELIATVNAAEPVNRAVPSVDPGVYWHDLEVYLNSETEDAVIYWTTDPKAKEYDDNWTEYDGAVEINRADAKEDEIGPDGNPTGRKKITLKVYTTKDRMRPDGPRPYTYVFANEIRVPEGQDHVFNGEYQIGVYDHDGYTLEAISQGIIFNENDDAMAKDPGTYQVKAKINEGYRWEIIDPETGVITYTTDDQTVTFKITEAPEHEYTVTLLANGGTLPKDKEKIKVIYGKPYGELPDPDKKERTFAGWYTDDSFKKKISPTDIYGIEGDSSLIARYEYEVMFREIDGVINTVNVYEDINKVKDPGNAPDKNGYAFDYWVKSSTEERFDFDNDKTSPKMVIAGKYHRYDCSDNEKTWILENLGSLSFRFVRYEHVFRDVLSKEDLKALFEENNKQLFADDVLLNEDQYSYRNGSLIVDLKGSYLNGLTVGKHSLTVRFSDGEATAYFYVKERTKPSTPEYIIPKTGR